jgi:hypothetical protein
MKEKTEQQKLQFLLANGWTLIGINEVRSPDGQVVTTIEKAYLVWNTKIQARKKIDQHNSNKFLRNHLTKRNILVRLFL